MTTIAANVNLYKTPAGKVGIVAGVLLFITGVILTVKHYTQPTQPAIDDGTTTSEEGTTQTPAQTNSTVASPSDSVTNTDSLPLGTCGPLHTDFDRVYNYVKCDGVWWTISKDKVKIKEWTSLANNKTASDLLNNKYSS